MDNTENPIEVEIVEETKTIKEIFKEQAANIALGVATLALAGWGAYDNYKRQNRKEQKYNDYLDRKVDILEDTARSYKDSLDNDRPEDPKELKD